MITNHVRIDAIVISTQHDDFDEEAEMLAKIKSDLVSILIPRVKKISSICAFI
jgi:S-adenosylmethionine synthetase